MMFWDSFALVTSYMWIFVQFWVSQTIFAKITLAIMTGIFGPLNSEGHLDLMANRENSRAARWITDAAVKGKKNIFWDVLARFVMIWVRLCDFILSISRGILGVDKAYDKGNS